MLLVDEELANRNSTAVTTRAEIQAAFAYLTSPLVHHARWLDTPDGAIVILSP